MVCPKSFCVKEKTPPIYSSSLGWIFRLLLGYLLGGYLGEGLGPAKSRTTLTAISSFGGLGMSYSFSGFFAGCSGLKDEAWTYFLGTDCAGEDCCGGGCDLFGTLYLAGCGGGGLATYAGFCFGSS